MNRKINLVVKSEKQYNKAIKKLEAIGAVGFLLDEYNSSKVGCDDYGIGYFQGHNRFTDGTSQTSSGWENYYTVKSYIAEVLKAQQEMADET